MASGSETDILTFEGEAEGVRPWSAKSPYANRSDDDDGKQGRGAGDKTREGDDPRDAPPPVIYGEEIEGPCNPRYVDGIPAAADCAARGRAVNATCRGTITGFIFPGSNWDNPQGIRGAIEEINRSIEFFARYCIFLKLDQFNPGRRHLRRMRRWYRHWYDNRLIPAVGGADHIGTTTIPTGVVDAFRGSMLNLQRLAVDSGVRLLIVFMDEYINDDRPSLGSSNRRDSHQIGIAWIDRKSPCILAHELVHAFGKAAPGTPGAVTWDHKSACPDALTTIGRTADSRNAIDLSGRYLDIAEDREIRANRGGNLLSCSAGGCPAGPD